MTSGLFIRWSAWGATVETVRFSTCSAGFARSNSEPKSDRSERETPR